MMEYCRFLIVMTAFCCLTGCLPSEGEQSSQLLQLSQTVVAHKATDKHLAFTDIEKTNDGKLLLVYREGDGHVEPNGRIMKQFGGLDGLSWDAPIELYNDKTYDDRDPSIMRLSNGDILLTFFKYHLSSDKQKSVPNIVHTFFARSKDNGNSFSEPIQIDPGKMSYGKEELYKKENLWYEKSNKNRLVPFKASSAAIVEGAGEKLFLPSYGVSPGLYGAISLGVSGDNGKTWSYQNVLEGSDEQLDLNEPALVMVDGSHWIMHVRTQKEGGYSYQTQTFDGGKSWSPYKNLGFIGHSPELIKLSNGVVVAAYRLIEVAGEKISGVKVALKYSKDKGSSWSDFIIVEDCGLNECGYPGLLELSNGKLAVSYYIVKKELSQIKVVLFNIGKS